MIQQMQTVCSDCQGKGEQIREEDKCKECKGKKVLKDKKVLTVYVDKGMRHGQKVVFAGESDEAVIIRYFLIILIFELAWHGTWGYHICFG
jgi:DnaJ family protein A protein 2